MSDHVPIYKMKHPPISTSVLYLSIRKLNNSGRKLSAFGLMMEWSNSQMPLTPVEFAMEPNATTITESVPEHT
jgi:hypothetical protein